MGPCINSQNHAANEKRSHNQRVEIKDLNTNYNLNTKNKEALQLHHSNKYQSTPPFLQLILHNLYIGFDAIIYE